MKRQPPRWADRFLEWYCNPDLLEDLQGDLHEIFLQNYDEGKGKTSQYLFIWNVLRSFRPAVIARNRRYKTQYL